MILHTLEYAARRWERKLLADHLKHERVKGVHGR